MGGAGTGFGGTAGHGPGSPLPWGAVIGAGVLLVLTGGVWWRRRPGRPGVTPLSCSPAAIAFAGGLLPFQDGLRPVRAGEVRIDRFVAGVAAGDDVLGAGPDRRRTLLGVGEDAETALAQGANMMPAA